MAIAARIIAKAARTRIERRDQHEVGRERRAGKCAADGHRAIFQRLAEDFQRLTIELRQLVQEQHAMMTERDFARRGNGTAADQACVTDGVVRRTEGPRGDKRLTGRQQADSTIDSRRFNGLRRRKLRQDTGHPLRQHGFS